MLEGLTPEQVEQALANISKLSLQEKIALMQELDALEERRRIQGCRDDFLKFCHEVYPSFKEGPHHRHVKPLLHDMAVDDPRHWHGSEMPPHALRLTVSMAPRFGKSIMIAFLYVAWYLGHNPTHHIMMVTHTASLSEGFGRQVRDLIDTPVYQRIFPDTKVSKDKSAAGDWTTTLGGKYLAVGVGANVAGHGAHLLVVDDLCVAPDTKLQTPKGLVPAKDIREGDVVLGFEGWVTVTRTVRTVHTTAVCIDGTVLSPEHPVWTFNHGWCYACDVKPGDVLQTTSLVDKIKLTTRSFYEQVSEKVRGLQARVQHLGHDEAALQQSESGKLLQLRGKRGVSRPAVEDFHPVSERHGSGTNTPAHTGSQGQPPWVQPGELPMGRCGDPTEQPDERAALRVPRQNAVCAATGANRRRDPAHHGASAQKNETDSRAGIGVPERLLGAAPRRVQEFGRLRRQALRLFGRGGKNEYTAGQAGRQHQESAVGRHKTWRDMVAALLGVRRVARVEAAVGQEFVCLSVSGSNTFYADGFLTHNCSEQAVLANPDAAFETAWTYMQVGPLQRLMPGGRIVMIGTRWSKKDPIGRALKWAKDNEGSLPWHEIRFPAVMDVERDGQTVQVSLWPEQWPLEQLLAKKAGMQNQFWAAQYMQEPTSEEAALLKREWWQVWESDEPPPYDYVIQSWDTAHETKNHNDYSACLTWGVWFNDKTNRYEIILLDAWKGRLEFPDLKDKAQKMAKHWEPEALLIEKKAAGGPLIQEMRRTGLFIEELNPSRGARGVSNDKRARVNAVAPILKDGLVWVPDMRWAREVMDECAEFPNGEHDDMVDCVEMALSRFRRGGFISLSGDADDNDDDLKAPRRAAYY